jgi:hypothetical protein
MVCHIKIIKQNFYVGNCFKRCAEIISIDDDGETIELYSMVEKSCGEYCCKRITRFCVQNGVIIREQPYLDTGQVSSCSNQLEENWEGTFFLKTIVIRKRLHEFVLSIIITTYTSSSLYLILNILHILLNKPYPTQIDK